MYRVGYFYKREYVKLYFCKNLFIKVTNLFEFTKCKATKYLLSTEQHCQTH